MNPDIHAALLILTMSLITIALRALPFGIFSGKRRVPEAVLYLGQVLPSAALGMLVVYCLRDISFSAAPWGLPELLSCGAVALTQLIKRNTILSILAGTILYMLLIHL